MNNTERCIREGPEWLDKLLFCDYFSACTFHKSAKPERNHFCIECNEGPICSAGLVSGHHGHQTLQIRKASHHDAIRVCDIQRVVDISGIQSYSINGAKIVFLLRPKAKLHHGRSHRRCINCKRGLHDAGMLMCSIKCKLGAVRNSLVRNHVGNNINQNNNTGFLDDDSMISLSLSNARGQIDRVSIRPNPIVVSRPNSNIPVVAYKEDCNSRLCDPRFQPLKKRFINYVKEMGSDNNNSIEGGDCKITIRFKLSPSPVLHPTRSSRPNIKGSTNDSPDSTLQKHQLHSCFGEEIRSSDQYQKMSKFRTSLLALEDREINISASFPSGDEAQYDFNSHHDNHHLQKSIRKSRRKEYTPHRAPLW